MSTVLLAGMPRSGSTLLRGILSQNPTVTATPYSGLSDLLEQTLDGWNVAPHQAFPRHEAQDRVLASIFRSYHPEDGVHVDLSRDWPRLVDLIERATSEPARIVCMVREPAAVFASNEKLYRDNPYDRWTRIPHGKTVEERVQFAEGYIGSAYRAIASAIDAGQGDRLLFVDYDKFLANPEHEMRRIYIHWRLLYVPHTFTDVVLKDRENDALHGPRDLHKIKPSLVKVNYRPEEIIGKRLTEHLKRTYPAFWNQWT